MIGLLKGFTTLARKENENIVTHCFLHHKALMVQTIGDDLRRVIDEVI